MVAKLGLFTKTVTTTEPQVAASPAAKPQDNKPTDVQDYGGYSEYIETFCQETKEPPSGSSPLPPKPEKIRVVNCDLQTAPSRKDVLINFFVTNFKQAGVVASADVDSTKIIITREAHRAPEAVFACIDLLRLMKQERKFNLQALVAQSLNLHPLLRQVIFSLVYSFTLTAENGLNVQDLGPKEEIRKFASDQIEQAETSYNSTWNKYKKLTEERDASSGANKVSLESDIRQFESMYPWLKK